MNQIESQQYDLGRQAHEAGYPVTACNVLDHEKASFWLAGWHDADIESGNLMYWPDR